MFLQTVCAPATYSMRFSPAAAEFETNEAVETPGLYPYGFDSYIGYLVAAPPRVLARGILPHVNIGNVTVGAAI